MLSWGPNIREQALGRPFGALRPVKFGEQKIALNAHYMALFATACGGAC